MTTESAIDGTLSQELIDEIVRRILSVCKPDRIILFGSAATGEMTRDSDIDLLIVESEPGDRREESVRIRRTLRRLGYPFDVIVVPTDYFERTKDILGSVSYPANRNGRAVYEAT